MRYDYVIVGGGPAAAAAAEAIRGQDPKGSILLVSRDNHPPYKRPPLSKDLWFGKAKLDDLPIHPDDFYRENGIELALRREVVELDPIARKLWDDRGAVREYGELLLATGGRPRLLDVPGSTLDGIHYYRDLEDYLLLQGVRFEHALVIGAGFIGVEMAAAIRHSGREVTLLFPEEYPLSRVLPRSLGLHLAAYYREKGVDVVSGEEIAAFEDRGGGTLLARTRSGNYAETQLVLAGIGLRLYTELADAVGIEVSRGIVVDSLGRTSAAHVWAAGDVTEFPDLALGQTRHVEHWDHALAHGKAVGANMAGANRPYDEMPVFFSDLFDIGWEAVGDLDPHLVVEEVWTRPNEKGVLFYLRDEVVRGVLLWNTWGLADWARALIREGRPMTVEERARAIPRDEEH